MLLFTAKESSTKEEVPAPIPCLSSSVVKQEAQQEDDSMDTDEAASLNNDDKLNDNTSNNISRIMDATNLSQDVKALTVSDMTNGVESVRHLADERIINESQAGISTFTAKCEPAAVCKLPGNDSLGQGALSNVSNCKANEQENLNKETSTLVPAVVCSSGVVKLLNFQPMYQHINASISNTFSSNESDTTDPTTRSNKVSESADGEGDSPADTTPMLGDRTPSDVVPSSLFPILPSGEEILVHNCIALSAQEDIKIR